MSIEALKWALDIGEEHGLEPAQRLVLIMLGNSADHTGGNLFPSHGFIARRTGLAKSTVRSHLAFLHKTGLLVKEGRSREDGSQTSNTYRLAMMQPGLALAEPPVPDSGRGVPDSSRRGARGRAGGVPIAGTLKTQEYKGDELKAGRALPSPVSLAFKAYADGIKRKYSADYPPSATANGQLSNVVARVGRDNVVAVVDAFFASQNPYYAKVKHRLSALVKDCVEIFLEIQAAAPGAKPPTHARVALLKADGSVLRELEQYPAGNMEEIAKLAAREYAGVIARLEPQYLSVVQGAERRRYAPSELVAR